MTTDRRQTPIHQSIILLLLGLAMLTACSSVPELDRSKPLDPTDIARRLEERANATQAVEAYGSISIDSPSFSGSSAMALKLLKPDSLQIEINGPFGMTLARGLVTSSLFLFYNGQDNTVAEGATNAENLRRILRVGLEFRDILDILSASMRLPGEGVPDAYTQDDLYVLTWNNATQSSEYTVDLKYLAVRKFLRRNADGDIMEEVVYRDFRRKGDRYFPHAVSIARPDSEESISLQYQTLAINDLPISFNFTYPKSARRVYF